RNQFSINVPVSESAASYWFNWALGALSVEAMFGLVKIPAWCRKMKIAAAAIAVSVSLSYLLPTLQGQNDILYNILWLCIHPLWGFAFFVVQNVVLDRKSTRLNSSHVSISYAVFCLKKK